MAPSTWQEWTVAVGLFIPLASLAWTGVSFSITHRREVRNAEFERFFNVMDRLGNNDGSEPSKLAAAYELREYPQYREVIVRMCRELKVTGGAAQRLKAEMLRTADYLEGNKDG